MSERWTRRSWLTVAATAAVVMIPIALIAATGDPLDPPPRERRWTILEEQQAPLSKRDQRRLDRQLERRQPTPVPTVSNAEPIGTPTAENP